MLEIKAKEARGREATWYESALRIATVLTFGDFGKVINYDGKKSLSVEDLFDKRVIFELTSLGNVEKKFFAEYLLTYIYKLKKANSGKVDEGFNHAILVDEAHNIFLKSKTYFVSESVTDMIYREMREYGTCLICLDQHISKLSDTVKGNSACHIAFQQQLPQDVYDVSSIMQLVDKKEIFSQLPVGHAVVKLSERYTSPFLIKVPYTDLRNFMISDEKIASKMDCVIQGIEVEKSDPEFREALIGEEKAQPIKENEIKINIEIPERLGTQETSKEKGSLTSVQEVLCNFICKQTSQGKSIKQAEKILEGGISECLYTETDILLAVNQALKNGINKRSINSLNVREKNEEKVIISNITNSDEERFIDFLSKNNSHNNSTVEIYKKIGLSSRKGNILKNKLLAKGIIQIREERNDKGWKKIIKLNAQNKHKIIANNIH
jgi:hypothetical protein